MSEARAARACETPVMDEVFDLSSTVVHLGLGATAVPFGDADWSARMIEIDPTIVSAVIPAKMSRRAVALSVTRDPPRVHARGYSPRLPLVNRS